MELQLPPGYRLEMDADIGMLRRHDGSAVAAFNVLGATVAAIEREAWADYRPPTLDHQRTRSMGPG
jgi:hypothetical protein